MRIAMPMPHGIFHQHFVPQPKPIEGLAPSPADYESAVLLVELYRRGLAYSVIKVQKRKTVSEFRGAADTVSGIC